MIEVYKKNRIAQVKKIIDVENAICIDKKNHSFKNYRRMCLAECLVSAVSI